MMDAAEIPAGDEPAKKKAAAKKAPAKTKPVKAAEGVETAPEAKPAKAAAPAKAAKAPAKGKFTKAAKSDEGAGELLFSSDRDDAPEPANRKPEVRPQPSENVDERALAPAMKGPAKTETPATEPVKPQQVQFKIVGDDEPAKKPAGSGNSRHEAVEFDPSAIFARFAPKPQEAAPVPAKDSGDASKLAPSGEARLESRPEAKWEDRRPARSDEASGDGRAPATGEDARNTESGESARVPGEESGVSGESAPRPGDSRPQQQNQQQRQDRQQGGQQRHPNDRQGQQQQGRQQQGGQQNPQQRQGHPGQQNGGQRHPNDRQQHGGKHGGKFQPPPRKQWPGLADSDSMEERELELGEVFNYNSLNDPAVLEEQAKLAAGEGEPFLFNELYASSMNEIVAAARNIGLKLHRTPQRRELVGCIVEEIGRQKRPIRLTGTLELLEDGNGLLVYGFDNYRVRELSAFIPKLLIKKHGLLRGHEIEALVLPARSGETAPMAVQVLTVMGADPEEVMQRTPFTELTPYYPTKRMLLETDNSVGWDNLSMRCVDLLCPVGLGQRGLIVAPPRTGKTVLMQSIANSITRNMPEVHLIVLLVDERPEEVTDFRRNSKANEVVSSTFDENAESHVHAAEMVIERARRMVEGGRHVVILLDSITRLARAYNTMVPSSGKILSGGIEAGALTRPKRFFGSARNIEGGGSLTILGTALVDTGSKMDEVIFEEFKGTGNMELDLDRDLANKRIFPAINFERSGTRKEELLYHPDEMMKIYALRRAMKGVPSAEAMEMLIQRVKKTKTNAEFLVTLSR